MYDDNDLNAIYIISLFIQFALNHYNGDCKLTNKISSRKTKSVSKIDAEH